MDSIHYERVVLRCSIVSWWYAAAWLLLASFNFLCRAWTWSMQLRSAWISWVVIYLQHWIHRSKLMEFWHPKKGCSQRLNACVWCSLRERFEPTEENFSSSWMIIWMSWGRFAGSFCVQSRMAALRHCGMYRSLGNIKFKSSSLFGPVHAVNKAT